MKTRIQKLMESEVSNRISVGDDITFIKDFFWEEDNGVSKGFKRGDTSKVIDVYDGGVVIHHVPYIVTDGEEKEDTVWIDKKIPLEYVAREYSREGNIANGLPPDMSPPDYLAHKYRNEAKKKKPSGGWGYNFKNKKEQIQQLVKFFERMRNGYIENDFNGDLASVFKYGNEDVEDQLTGVSGEVNGNETDDIFVELMKGLSTEELKIVSDKISKELGLYWTHGNDWVNYEQGDYRDWAEKNGREKEWIDSLEQGKDDFEKEMKSRSSEKAEAVGNKYTELMNMYGDLLDKQEESSFNFEASPYDGDKEWAVYSKASRTYDFFGTEEEMKKKAADLNKMDIDKQEPDWDAE